MLRLMQVILLFLACFSMFIDGTTCLTCLDENGKPVEWFVIYKLPRSSAYAYLDANQPYQWVKSRYLMNDTEGGSVAHTVMQVLRTLNSSSVFTAIYNDEKPHPGNDSGDAGHMKGIVSFSHNSTGLWLIHSLPKFPGENNYSFPSSGVVYGQTFFCATYNYSTLKTIGSQLLYGFPQVYSSNLPEIFATEIPDLVSIVKNKKQTLSTKFSFVNLVTQHGILNVTDFMKTSSFGTDLYSVLVAPTLATDIQFEGWINGHGDLNSSCDTVYKVENIRGINFVSLQVHFNTSHDHAKWAIQSKQSVNFQNRQTEPWICIGDINRQTGQYHRGGGTACFRNNAVWKEFHQLVADLEACPLLPAADTHA